MAANALVTTRINESVKQEAAEVLATMGLTVSDAVRLLLTKVAKEKTLPFEIWQPNADTVAAIQAARAGELEEVTLDQLQAVLNADD